MLCIFTYICIYIYIYIYLFIYLFITGSVGQDGTDAPQRDENIRRVRAPVFYRNLWKKTVFHQYLQEMCFVLTEISGNLHEFHLIVFRSRS